MKVMILTVSAGEGHNSIGRAVSDYLKNTYGADVDVMTYDIFKGKSKLKSYIANDVYFMSGKYFLTLSNAIYRKIKSRDPKKNANSAVHSFSKASKPQVIEKINEFKPDAIFCTHVISAHIMSDLKQRKLTNVPTVSIIHDYDVQPYTETTLGIEYIVSPHKDFNDEIIRKGFRPEQVLDFGLPVGQKFTTELDKVAARAELNIDLKKFTVMIMNGGIGFGNTLKQIKNLLKIKREFQIVCICGKNKKQKKLIDKYVRSHNIKNIYCYGYVNNVDMFMSAADIYIGKIGGVSIFETMGKRLPIIATTNLLWQEYYNMKYMTERGAMDYIDKPANAYKILEKYIIDRTKLDDIKKNIELLRKPNAARDIGEFILQLKK